jgi:hypothetical protein|tara:strand:- start:1358 stop:1660 length:303 start_codon:yes stop_codon:yes gene_type:complete
MNISMILIGGGVLVGALAFLPKGEKEREQVDYEYVEGMEQAPGFDPVTGWWSEVDFEGFIPLPAVGDSDEWQPPDVGFPMGEPERALTTSGEIEVLVGVR